MTVVAFIPARKGSTRIPHKNLAPVGGTPLVVRAIRAAEYCGRVVVSTDDDEIARVAESYRAETERTFRHTSTTQIEQAIAHWMRRESPVLADDDVIVMLQPTTPFRRAETVRRCAELVASGGYDTAHTVHLDRRNPFRGGRCHILEEDEYGRPLVVRPFYDRPAGWTRQRSQDIRDAPEETGGCYAFTARHFRETGSRMGGREAGVVVGWLEALEIDTPRDLAVARIFAPHVERLRAAYGTAA